MTTDQRRIADELLATLRARFLRDSERWPEDWDGLELRLLLNRCVEELRPQKHRHMTRFTMFENERVVNNF